MKITLLVQIRPKYCMRYTKMWGSSLKYVSNNSNIKDKGQLRLLKNAKKNGVEIIANFVRCDDDSFGYEDNVFIFPDALLRYLWVKQHDGCYLFKIIWISSNEVNETGAYYTEWSRPERKTPIQYTNA